MAYRPTAGYPSPPAGTYYRPPFGLMILSALSVLDGVSSIVAGALLASTGDTGMVAAAILLVMLGGGFLLVGYGLYKGREWARISAIVIYGAALGVGAYLVTQPSPLPTLGFVEIIVCVAVIVYLNTPDVVRYFEYIKRVGTLTGRPPTYYPQPPQGPQPQGYATHPYPRAPAPAARPQPSPPAGPTVPPRVQPAGPPAGPTVPGAAGPSYTLEFPDGRRMRVVNEAVRVFGREDFAGYAEPRQLEAITRRVRGGHFTITVAANPAGGFDYYIEDRGSTNGTKLNGEEIRGAGPKPLKDGDLIEVGGVLRLRFAAL